MRQRVAVSGLVKQFGAEVSQGGPGDQYGGDKGEHAEGSDDEYEVRTFNGIHKAAVSFHGVLLLLSFFNYL